MRRWVHGQKPLPYSPCQAVFNMTLKREKRQGSWYDLVRWCKMHGVYSYAKGALCTHTSFYPITVPAVNWTGLKPPSLRTSPRNNVVFGLLLDYFGLRLQCIFDTLGSRDLIEENTGLQSVYSDFVIPELSRTVRISWSALMEWSVAQEACEVQHCDYILQPCAIHWSTLVYCAIKRGGSVQCR